MAIKESYNYASKQKIRKELKDFIEKNYPKQGQRKGLKVLSLMGHEEHELNTIYDPLEIPRQNITVVERNPEIYNIIKNKNLGVKTIEGTLEEYVLKTKEKFNIINLDFQGHFDYEKIDAISRIVYNQTLEDRGILATWFFGKREKKETTKAFQGFQNNFLLSLKEQLNKYNKQLDFDNSFDFELNKSGVITAKILISFLNGKTNYKTHPFIDSLNFREEYHEYIKKDLGEEFKNWFNNLVNCSEECINKDKRFQQNPEILKAISFAKKLQENKQISGEEKKFIFEPWAKACSREFVVNKLEKEIEKQILPQQSSSQILDMLSRGALKTRNRNAAEMLSLLKINSCLCADLKRFYYISDDNSPFYVDMFLFKSAEHFSDFLWNYSLNNGKIIINPVRETSWKIEKKYEQYKNALNKTCGDLPLRIYINKQGEVVNQKEEYQNIWSTINRTIEANSNFNISERITISQTKKLIENKTLSKEEAIYLLKEGFTPKEIIEVYPEEYTLYQLEAFRYWHANGKTN